MKIAILYICTGRYAQFFHDFYQSAKQYFLPMKTRLSLCSQTKSYPTKAMI